MNQDFIKNLLQLYENPLFAEGFLEYFARMQHAGIDAARQFWATNQRQDVFPGNAAELFEQMIAFYSGLGFVPKQQYDDIVKENDRLKKENELLKSTLRELNLKVFTEGSVQVQEMWKEIAQKNIETNAEIAKNFLDLFKQEDGK